MLWWTKPSLFDQVKNLEIEGSWPAGDPKILHAIQDHFQKERYHPITRAQIQEILRAVPRVFPEGWESPEGYGDFSEEQHRVYGEIQRAGVAHCSGPDIQKVIELALEFRERCVTRVK